MVDFYLFPSCPHLAEMGKRRMPQRGHVDVDAEKGKKGAGDQVMGVHEELDPSDHDDPPPQRCDVHQEETAGDNERQEQEHDEQVAHFLDGIELVVQRGVMGIFSPQKIFKEIEESLSEDPLFDIVQIGDIDFYQIPRYEQIVKYPKEEGDRYGHAGDIVQFDSCLIRAEDIGILRESDLYARDTKGDNSESV